MTASTEDWQAARQELARITAELRETLAGLRRSAQLSGLVQSELPDAQAQLSQVLELTEQAANDTLSAVESSLPLARGIGEQIGDFRMQSADALARDERLVVLLDGIETAAETVKCHLGEVLMAQGFQDLTGQIIRRVAGLVNELESCLSSHGCNIDEAERQVRRDLREATGRGPARPDADRREVVSGQQDVDDLLSGLGI